MLALVGISMRLYRRFSWALVGGTVVVMLVTQGVYFYGLSRSGEEQSVCKEAARRIKMEFPEALVYAAGPKVPPRELAIYLDRVVRPVGDVKSLRGEIGADRVCVEGGGDARGV